MELTEKFQLRLSKSQQSALFVLAARRSLRTGKRLSAADYVRELIDRDSAKNAKLIDVKPQTRQEVMPV